MKKIILFFAFLLATGLISIRAQDTWVQKSDLGHNTINVPEPSSRSRAVGFSIGDKGYVGTGNVINDFWEYDPNTNIWTQKADFGGGIRSGATGFSIGSKGYIGMGNHYSFPYTPYYKDFWEYDPSLNKWTQKADFGGESRSIATGFNIGNKGYIGTGSKWGGSSSTYFKDFWEYDPVLDTWLQKADFGGGARGAATGFSIGNYGYLGTGSNYPWAASKDFWQYDPGTDMWTQKADFAGIERQQACGFSIGNKGYIGTGYLADEPYFFYIVDDVYQDFWEYDPAVNTWTEKAALGEAVSNAVGFSIAGKGYIGTGQNGYDVKKDFREYDPTSNSWTKKADFGGSARSGAVGFSIGNKGYIGTGYDGDFEKDFWEYDPDVNTWTQKADFGGGDRSGACGFSIGSKGYIGTGYTKGGDGYEQNHFEYHSDFWEYDPAANTWTVKAGFGGGERSNAASFSIGGKGYVGTGLWSEFIQYYGDDFYSYKDFWEYDPSVDNWTQIADFGGTARYSAVAFSIDSNGYLGTGAGGYYGVNSDDFWQYDPALNTWTQKMDFGGTARYSAVGFSIGGKGYIGTGAGGYYGVTSDDFWQYEPVLNTWTQKVDFGGTARFSAVGFSIGGKGYLGTGSADYPAYNKKDFWEYTPESPVPTCTIHTTLATINISSTTATFKWLGISEALSYKLRYKTAGNSEWTFTKSINNYKTIQGLTPNTEYTWQVKSFCDIQPVVTSDWSEKQFFTTDELRLSEADVDEMNFSIYPNPLSSSATVSFFLTEESNVTIELMDVNRRSIRVIANKSFSAGTHEVTINRESLVAGIYFLQLKTNAGVMMKKMVIE
ncbi:MAG: T9SS type A sorting domain-containing protein [Chitinophagales bacterium]|nr:T9SS type A sorting domain-containing protein [Chitinophagales bacterium]